MKAILRAVGVAAEVAAYFWIVGAALGRWLGV